MTTPTHVSGLGPATVAAILKACHADPMILLSQWDVPEHVADVFLASGTLDVRYIGHICNGLTELAHIDVEILCELMYRDIDPDNYVTLLHQDIDVLTSAHQGSDHDYGIVVSIVDSKSDKVYNIVKGFSAALLTYGRLQESCAQCVAEAVTLMKSDRSTQ